MKKVLYGIGGLLFAVSIIAAVTYWIKSQFFEAGSWFDTNTVRMDPVAAYRLGAVGSDWRSYVVNYPEGVTCFITSGSGDKMAKFCFLTSDLPHNR